MPHSKNNASVAGTWYPKDKCKFSEESQTWELIDPTAVAVATPPKAITSPAEDPKIDSAAVGAGSIGTKPAKSEKKAAKPKKKSKKN